MSVEKYYIELKEEKHQFKNGDWVLILDTHYENSLDNDVLAYNNIYNFLNIIIEEYNKRDSVGVYVCCLDNILNHKYGIKYINGVSEHKYYLQIQHDILKFRTKLICQLELDMNYIKKYNNKSKNEAIMTNILKNDMSVFNKTEKEKIIFYSPTEYEILNKIVHNYKENKTMTTLLSLIALYSNCYVLCINNIETSFVCFKVEKSELNILLYYKDEKFQNKVIQVFSAFIDSIVFENDLVKINDHTQNNSFSKLSNYKHGDIKKFYIEGLSYNAFTINIYEDGMSINDQEVSKRKIAVYIGEEVLLKEHTKNATIETNMIIGYYTPINIKIKDYIIEVKSGLASLFSTYFDKITKKKNVNSNSVKRVIQQIGEFIYAKCITHNYAYNNSDVNKAVKSFTEYITKLYKNLHCNNECESLRDEFDLIMKKFNEIIFLYYYNDEVEQIIKMVGILIESKDCDNSTKSYMCKMFSRKISNFFNNNILDENIDSKLILKEINELKLLVNLRNNEINEEDEHIVNYLVRSIKVKQFNTIKLIFDMKNDLIKLFEKYDVSNKNHDDDNLQLFIRFASLVLEKNKKENNSEYIKDSVRKIANSIRKRQINLIKLFEHIRDRDGLVQILAYKNKTSKKKQKTKMLDDKNTLLQIKELLKNQLYFNIIDYDKRLDTSNYVNSKISNKNDIKKNWDDFLDGYIKLYWIKEFKTKSIVEYKGIFTNIHAMLKSAKNRNILILNKNLIESKIFYMISYLYILNGSENNTINSILDIFVRDTEINLLGDTIYKENKELPKFNNEKYSYTSKKNIDELKEILNIIVSNIEYTKHFENDVNKIVYLNHFMNMVECLLNDIKLKKIKKSSSLLNHHIFFCVNKLVSKKHEDYDITKKIYNKVLSNVNTFFNIMGDNITFKNNSIGNCLFDDGKTVLDNNYSMLINYFLYS